MDPRTRTDLIELLRRWRLLLEESLPILERLEVSLSEAPQRDAVTPQALPPALAPRTSSNEELLIALLESFERQETAGLPQADAEAAAVASIDDPLTLHLAESGAEVSATAVPAESPHDRLPESPLEAVPEAATDSSPEAAPEAVQEAAPEAMPGVTFGAEGASPADLDAQSRAIQEPAIDDDAPVVLVRRDEVWGAFPWDALQEVCAIEAGSDSGEDARYHLIYRSAGQEHVLAVAEVGRILTRGEARTAGILEEWVLPAHLGGEAMRRTLAAPLPQPRSEFTPEPELSTTQDDADAATPAGVFLEHVAAEAPVDAIEAEASLAAPAAVNGQQRDADPESAPAATDGIDASDGINTSDNLDTSDNIDAHGELGVEPEPETPPEPPLSWDPQVRLETVLVLEFNAESENGFSHADAVTPVEPEKPALIAPEVAVVAVRYLPARVALARALRLAGWAVREEADPQDALTRLRETRPGLLCLELSDEVGQGEEVARELVRGGTQLYIVASRHRVVDPASLSDLPRLLHPFTEGELARLPAPASVGPAA